MSDPDATIRASAATGLGHIGKEAKVDLPSELAGALGDESPIVRQAATKSLKAAQLTSSVVPALIASLASHELEVRFHATEILARLGPAAKTAVPALLTILSEPFDQKERANTQVVAWDWDPACGAAKALSQIGASPETIAGLSTMLASSVPERVSCAADGLEKLGPAAASAVPALITAYENVLNARQHVIGQNTIPKALGQLAPQSPRASGAISILTRALDSADKWVRMGAIDALANFGRDAAGAVPRLRDLKQDPVREVQESARKALAAIETASSTGDSRD